MSTEAPPIEIDASFTSEEAHVLGCAMAGQFPPSLNEYRMPALRKLARLTKEHEEAAEAVPQ